jgi:phosphoribosylglycinamide formyltransferase-1
MYGGHVHEAVVANHEKESGITIHIIDNQYDRGQTLFQAKCQVTEEDTPDTLAAKIHKLEQQYFPVVIEKTVLG